MATTLCEGYHGTDGFHTITPCDNMDKDTVLYRRNGLLSTDDPQYWVDVKGDGSFYSRRFLELKLTTEEKDCLTDGMYSYECKMMQYGTVANTPHCPPMSPEDISIGSPRGVKAYISFMPIWSTPLFPYIDGEEGGSIRQHYQIPFHIFAHIGELDTRPIFEWGKKKSIEIARGLVGVCHIPFEMEDL